MNKREIVAKGHRVDYNEETKVVSIYRSWMYGNPLVEESSEEPLVSFAYGMYTKEEIKEMLEDLPEEDVEEILDFETRISAEKIFLKKYQEELEREREKLKLWDMVCCF